jgi:hypothetical protein
MPRVLSRAEGIRVPGSATASRENLKRLTQLIPHKLKEVEKSFVNLELQTTPVPTRKFLRTKIPA